MLNLFLNLPTKLYLGRGEENAIGEHIRPYAGKVLLHYGGGSVKRSGLYDRVAASLNKAGIAFTELGGVQPNPRVTLVREGIALARGFGAELILAIGGGSAIDSAKAIAMGVLYDGDVWDIYDKQKHTVAGKALPVATVCTIPAAGSEMSDSSVISNADTLRKYGHSEECIRPVVSVINPELYATLPQHQAANGVADMMMHIFERYFTRTENTDVTDALCEGLLKAIMKNAPAFVKNPGNYNAAAEIGFAGALAHNNLVGVGRAQDWASHHIEHELSAIYDVAHGAGLAVICPAWLRYVYRCDRDGARIFRRRKLVQFAHNIMDVPAEITDPDAAVMQAIDKLAAFWESLGLPSALSELGIPADRLEEMAKKSTGADTAKEFGNGSFLRLNWQDTLAILQSCA
ncbi:MAG: iron-containing alcohol dehydrogenase [Oscillospiraceae bacterium]|jgi:alcohol dehydrogenase YqhD (iron-dependent ADH family)|nr:iron-containing alcohol dehydrogenase [Oscillospiraceae bacterium]